MKWFSFILQPKLISVNHGLKESSLKNILGLEFDLIINAMKSYSKNIAEQHPAKKMMQKIAMSKDKSVLDKIIKYKTGLKEAVNIASESLQK